MMISKEEFRNYVKTIVENNKETINKDFKKKRKGSPVGFILFFIVFIISIFTIATGSTAALFILVPIIFFASFFIMIIGILRSHTSSNNNYKSEEYKAEVVEYLLKNYNYSYDKDGGIDSSEYNKSPMYADYDRYETEDHLRINLSNGTSHKSDCWLNICDLYTCKEVREEVGNSYGRHNHSYGNHRPGIRFSINFGSDNFNNDGFFHDDHNTHLFDNDFNRYETRYVKVFDGSFGYIQFNDNFKTNLYVNCPSYAYRGKVEYVKLEDINFNKKFLVYSGDQVEARYILNPRTMELIDELNNKVNRGTTKVRRVISIALVGNRMYFTFSGGFKLFELNKYYKNEGEIFDNFYDDMEIILKLIEEIQNNSKIFKI